MNIVRLCVLPTLLFASLGASISKADDCRPETWFHFIGGNVSKEGVAADIKAIADAGIGGIQLFHGQFGSKWPGTGEPIACLSPKWDDIIKFTAEECARRGIKFKMQNCPGWSMSGGPWISPRNAMRKLVVFEPGKMPKFSKDDDYCEIGTVTFPVEAGEDETLKPAKVERYSKNGLRRYTFRYKKPVTVRSVHMPSSKGLAGRRVYHPEILIKLSADGETVMRREAPQGAWQSNSGMTFAVDKTRSAKTWVLEFNTKHGYACSAESLEKAVSLSAARRIDNWEAKAGRELRSLEIRDGAERVKPVREKTLVFGHVNAKYKNAPAPREATGYECDKMDAEAFEKHFNGYIGRLAAGPLKGGLLKGFLLDSWECHTQNWTWKMEDEFKRLNGYELRPWLPALFGYVLKSEKETEAFLLDWRRTCSYLIEENYFRKMAEKAHEYGMTVQFETAFGDVLPGDLLRFWKYADEPMCEFWRPFDGSKTSGVGTHDYKPVRPCVSAAHVYGKKRVSAESFTSFVLTFDERFQELKEDANRFFARGVTHIVFHTFTHNPRVDGLPPGSSFGARIGMPFTRLQTWWPFMKEFTHYLKVCGRELERGKPVVDIVMYLGDALGHKPWENFDYFGDRYKVDYINYDALSTRADVKDGLVSLPDGMAYKVLWVPEGTYLLPKTEALLKELEAKGARIVRGNLKPDWTPQMEASGEGGIFWYQRRDGDETTWFVAARERKPFKGEISPRGAGKISLDLAPGESRIVKFKNGKVSMMDPVTEAAPLEKPAGANVVELKDWSMPLGNWKDLKGSREEKLFSGTRTYKTTCVSDSARKAVLSLGKTCYWARVFVNGKETAALWCEPWMCEIELEKGANEIRVDVTSTWYNRLIFDAGQPVENRKTWTIGGPGAKSSPGGSGLVGPVRLYFDSSASVGK